MPTGTGHGMTHDTHTDTRECGRSTLTAALAVRVVGRVPTTAGRAATKGWVLYCNDARTDAEGRGQQQSTTHIGRVKDQSAAA